MADFVKPTTAIKLQFWKDTIFFLFIVYRQSLRCWFLWVIVREIHISFLDSLQTLHIRRIAILIVYLSLKVDEIFADCNSPALIEIHSSCAFRL
jgi:hypothetical protein